MMKSWYFALWGIPPIIGGIPSKRVSNAEFWCFLSCTSQQTFEQTMEWRLIWDVRTLMWRHCNDMASNATMHFCIPTWWHHQMETFSALLAICAGNSPVPGEFPTQRPVTRSFDVYFDLRPNKRLSKQPWGWWFETPTRSLWRQCNEHNVQKWNWIRFYMTKQGLYQWEKILHIYRHIPLADTLSAMDWKRVQEYIFFALLYFFL